MDRFLTGNGRVLLLGALQEARGAGRQGGAQAFQASVVDVADRDQILRWLTAAPRLESVSACRILLEEPRRDGGSPAGIESVIDELSAKRKGARSC
jgi:hypothetical protein